MTRTDYLQGTLDLLILQTLTAGPMHGYGIARAIEQVTRKALQIEEGSLYPALHRMERKGWLASEWGRSENNRRARYYGLTDEGRARLGSETRQWNRFIEAVDRVLQPAREGSA
ncbi:MAG: PadR family transcriptional regulator [bacterium]